MRKPLIVEKWKFDKLLGKLIASKPAPKDSIKASKKRPAKVISPQ